MLKFQTVAVLTKPSDLPEAPVMRLLEALRREVCAVLLEDRVAERCGLPERNEMTRLELCAAAELVVVLGGDGSMLGAMREAALYRRPVIGVNAGHLGFITDITMDDMEAKLPAMLHGDFIRDRRYLLEGSVRRGTSIVCCRLGVNDIGISHGRAGGMVDFIIYVDGEQVASQSADGIICSSPTGSTAYSVAAGGPILHPSLQGLVLVPVAPHTLSNRPIVLPTEMTVELELTEARDAVAYFDMQEFFDIKPGDVLRIRQSTAYAEMLHPRDYDYFELLRRKLHWNFMPKEDHKRREG